MLYSVLAQLQYWLGHLSLEYIMHQPITILVSCELFQPVWQTTGPKLHGADKTVSSEPGHRERGEHKDKNGWDEAFTISLYVFESPSFCLFR